MGQRGPKAKPTHLALLHGNPSKLPQSNDEPEGVGILWAPPAWFDEEQRAQWAYAIENSSPGLLTGTDREVLVVWTVASVEHARAAQEVRKLGQVVKTKEGNAIQNPFLPIVNRQALIMMRAGAEMGFSPASRASIGRGEPLPAGRAGQIAGTPLAAYLAEKPDKLDD
jgi:P27 family predicted phage terminase small subunit